ncbi:apurinic/apyrimidinic endonuclease family protein [Micromonospora craniellae]|uniref:AP endonuclease n=1 Tax=Micromonospora craniellae TaxID=2294034 RepID=UPI0011C0FA4F|nr:AP endonuclease [Micromonospora craniellae]QOC93848.1 AP endonuclease [Micromonospora craniellae]
MTRRTVAAVGLYSIGIRGIEMEDLFALSTAYQIPFLHLRGGQRGFDLARRDTTTLDRWACRAQSSPPITAVTADLDLADFNRPGTQAYRRANAELDRLADATALLGTHSVRLLARRVIEQREWAGIALPNLAQYGMTTLIELHDPAWFTGQPLASMAAYLDRVEGLALLIDTAQVHSAYLRAGSLNSLGDDLAALERHTRVVHISDNGYGLTGGGHRIVAQTFGRAGDDGHVEVAFEWTGADRSVQECMSRYRYAVRWWRSSLEAGP